MGNHEARVMQIQENLAKKVTAGIHDAKVTIQNMASTAISQLEDAERTWQAYLGKAGETGEFGGESYETKERL